jgi:hypothetical protein
MPPAPEDTRRRWLFWTGVAVFNLGVIAVFWFIFEGARTSLEAERTHQAYVRVLGATTAFVRGHPGLWPNGWEQLATAAPEGGDWSQTLPDDLEDVRRRIHVDFDLSAADVSKMNADDFSAIRPIGPNYGPDPVRIQMLIDATKAE